MEDHYALLGIDVDADAAALRRAWRRLALRWHPDRAGPGAADTFKKIAAAYAVLSDPVARAAYDRRWVAAGIGCRARAARAPSTPPPAARRRAPGVMLSRLSGPLNALLTCGVARRAEDEIIELFLDAEEATRGGMVTIAMRVAVRCPACAVDATVACTRCGGKRTVAELFSAWLAVSPGVEDGAILAPSAQLPGIVRPVRFRLRRRAPR